ncbi:NACHT, LRR and PYD domains-containing protein 3-like isoform X2 [Salminus brasiliensis]
MEDQHDLCNEDMSTAQSPVLQDGAVPSAPSCVSVKSHHSMDHPISIKAETASPAPSSLSMKSSSSMKRLITFPRENPSIPSPVQLDRSGSLLPSNVSVKSHHSMDPPITIKDKALPSSPLQQDRSVPSAPSCASLKSRHSMDPPNTFTANPLPSGREGAKLRPERKDRTPKTIKTGHSVDQSVCLGTSAFQIPLQQDRSVPSAPSCASLKSRHSMDPPNTFTANPLHSGREGAKLRPERKDRTPKTIKTGRSVDQSVCLGTSAFQMLPLSEGGESYEKFKSSLKDRFQWLSDQLPNDGHSELLNEIYTELYITEGDSGEVNSEHEVRQIEMAARTHLLMEDTAIKCNDIFKPVPGQDKLIRTVLTKGVAGIGKTVSVQKFILDWVEGEANPDIHFIFPLPFRELNLMNDQRFSLEGLVHHFIPQLKEMTFTAIAAQKIVFIFDGLDERRSPLDFQNGMIINSVTEIATVDMLLTNLIKGNLLPMAKVWITSRPAASSQIPLECVSQVTEIRGFNDPQKEEYFKKRISDQSLANRTITHLKSSRSLYIMCHIPVFCWISAVVLERMLREAEDATIPKTLTQMYTHFLIIQTSIRKEKYGQSGEVDKEMIIKLGRLAFNQLIKGNLIFYEEDLRECDIDVKDAIVYSGVCTQIFREEAELHHGRGKVFCFVHLSIQEHLAALYVYISFSEGNKKVLNQWNPTNIAPSFSCSSISDLQQSAVDKALRSPNGQFDLFLRFLLGLSLENNLSLLQVLLPRVSAHCSESAEKTIDYIKIRLRIDLSPEKYINLFHCLNELNDSSLQDEIQNLLSSGRLLKTKLSPAQWSALVFVLLTSDREVTVFDLRKYSLNNADECLYRMLPVVESSRTAEVRQCNLSDKGFQALTSALGSKSSNLRELKLSGNTMHESGIKILCEGFKSLHCKLEILDLSDCDIRATDCSFLASALNFNPLHLKGLDLSFNLFGDLGMMLLSEVLGNPKCRLEKLKLFSCGLTEKICAALSAVLNSNPSLTELDLSKNALQDRGVKLLSSALTNPHFKLRSLSLTDCGVTEVGCESLCVALHLNPSHLSELCLTYNTLRDSGVRILAGFVKQPYCKLEKLSLSQCDITEEGCAALASALRLNPSHLRELELYGNKPGLSGKDQLRALQEHKGFRLEKLKL